MDTLIISNYGFEGLPELAVFYAKEANGPWSKVPVISSKPGVKSDLEIYASGVPSGKIYLRVENGDLKSRDFSTTIPPASKLKFAPMCFSLNNFAHLTI